MRNGNKYQGKQGAPGGECCVEKRSPTKVLEKYGTKEKSVKSKLWSTERGGAKLG